MSPARRDLMFRVMDGERKILPYLHHFDGYTRCDYMLSWLIDNHLTGKNFLDWTQKYFPTGFMDCAVFILTRIDKDKESRPIIIGRDFN